MCAVTTDPCTECLPPALAEMKQFLRSYCAICTETKVDIFRAVWDELEKTEPALAATLRAGFLAAGGACVSKAAEIFFSFGCTTGRLYPLEAKMRAFYQSFMDKYPSLAVEFYTHYETFVVSYTA